MPDSERILSNGLPIPLPVYIVPPPGPAAQARTRLSVQLHNLDARLDMLAGRGVVHGELASLLGDLILLVREIVDT